MFEGVWTGLLATISGMNLLYLALGLLVGMLFGFLPGLGGGVGMALLLPMTWSMETTSAFLLLVGVYGSVIFSGSISAILFNVPGTAPNAATLFDGYPMAQQGKAKTALACSATASAMGTIVSLILFVVAIPLLYRFTLIFGPPEFFLLALMGLSVISAVSEGSTIKGLISGGVGLLASFIGFHPLFGSARYSFGSLFLFDGIKLVPALIGAFAISQAIKLMVDNTTIAPGKAQLTGSIADGVWAVGKHFGLFLRSSLIGLGIGAIPGTGAAVASFLAYMQAIKTCKNKENFGKGDIRGVIAAEAANNGSVGGVLIPTLFIGIPGSEAGAILLAALTFHGLFAGPQLFVINSELVYSIIWGLAMSCLLASVVGIALAGYFEKLTKMTIDILGPIIMIISLVGAYAITQDVGDIVVAVVFGIIGYYMLKFGYSTVPLILGLILGPIAEKGFFQALAISDIGYAIFFVRPVSLVLIVGIILSLFFSRKGAPSQNL